MTQNQKEYLLTFIEEHFNLFLTFDIGFQISLDEINKKHISLTFITTDFETFSLKFYPNEEIKLYTGSFQKERLFKGNLPITTKLSKEEHRMMDLIIFCVEKNMKLLFDRQDMFLETKNYNKYLTFYFKDTQIFVNSSSITLEEAFNFVEILKNEK